MGFDGLYEGPQFEPVGGWPGRFADEGIYTYGFGDNQGQGGLWGSPDWKRQGQGGDYTFVFSIVDQVQVPQNLPPGLYALSHRYDCEETTQVWNTCANVLILPANDTTPDGMLIPDGPSGIVEVDRLME